MIIYKNSIYILLLHSPFNNLIDYKYNFQFFIFLRKNQQHFFFFVFLLESDNAPCLLEFKL